jgi:imidazolonepropionase-like amidohydrolase
MSRLSTLAFSVSLVFASVAPTLSSAETALSILDCTVFDPETEKLLPRRTIVIRGQRIVAVNGPDQPSEIPPDAVRIDGRGKFALPGLIDAHLHLVHVSDFARVTGAHFSHAK